MTADPAWLRRMPPEWQDSASRANALEAWDADLDGALGGRDGAGLALAVYRLRLDRRVLALVDKSLQPFVESATFSKGDALAEVRSANVEVSALRWISASKRARSAGSPPDHGAGKMMLPMLIQRFDERQRHTLADIAVTLPSELVDDLDTEIQGVIESQVTADVMEPDELTEWISDMSVWDDLRASVIEAGLRVWLLMRGVDPDQPAQPKRSRGRHRPGPRRDHRR